MTDLAFELEVAFDVLAEYRANLTHNAHELFERQWADQEREIDALMVSLSEAHVSREEASRQVRALLVCNCNLPSGGLAADIEAQERRIAELTQFLEEGKQRLNRFSSRGEVCACAFEEEEKKCIALEKYIRNPVEPH